MQLMVTVKTDGTEVLGALVPQVLIAPMVNLDSPAPTALDLTEGVGIQVLPSSFQPLLGEHMRVISARTRAIDHSIQLSNHRVSHDDFPCLRTLKNHQLGHFSQIEMANYFTVIRA